MDEEKISIISSIVGVHYDVLVHHVCLATYIIIRNYFTLLFLEICKNTLTVSVRLTLLIVIVLDILTVYHGKVNHFSIFSDHYFDLHVIFPFGKQQPHKPV